MRFWIGLFGLFAPLFLGCGQPFATLKPRAGVVDATMGGAYSYTDFVYEGDYACPRDYNVTPGYDYAMNGEGKFKACHHRYTASRMKLRGTPAGGDTICVIPVKMVASDQVYAYPDLRAVIEGRPQELAAVLCYRIPTSGVYADFTEFFSQFQGASIDGVFVVSSSSKVQMLQCLINNDALGCPDYSFGKLSQ